MDRGNQAPPIQKTGASKTTGAAMYRSNLVSKPAGPSRRMVLSILPFRTGVSRPNGGSTRRRNPGLPRNAAPHPGGAVNLRGTRRTFAGSVRHRRTVAAVIDSGLVDGLSSGPWVGCARAARFSLALTRTHSSTSASFNWPVLDYGTDACTSSNYCLVTGSGRVRPLFPFNRRGGF